MTAVPARSIAAQRAASLALKGTVLLAEKASTVPRGRARCRARFLGWLRADARFADLEPKESWSERAALSQAAGQGQARDHPHEPSGDPAGARPRARRSTQPRSSAGSTRATTTKAGPSSCSTRATPSRSDHGTLRRCDRLAHRASSAISRRRLRRTAAQLAGKTVRELLHRRHPLREGGDLMREAGVDHVCSSTAASSSTSRRRPAALPRQLLRVRRARGPGPGTRSGAP